MRPTSHSIVFAAASLVLVAASSALLVGCEDATAPEPEPVATATVDAAAVNTALAAVAAARQPVADAVDAELRAVVRIDPMVAGLRSPSSIDATLQDVPTIVALVDEVDLAVVGQRVDTLDGALGEAVAAVDTTMAQVEGGSWQAEFLAAQRDVLDSLATWSAASRAVDTVVDDNWELWSATVADAADLDENRWRYRSMEEAAGTWEIEISDRLGPLAQAAAAVEQVSAARDEAAAAVTAADAHAADVFAARPAGT